MKWHRPYPDGKMHEVDEPKGSFISYEEHLEELVGVERRAKKAFLDQSDSYWKIEYDRIMRDYGHLFMGII